MAVTITKVVSAPLTIQIGGTTQEITLERRIGTGTFRLVDPRLQLDITISRAAFREALDALEAQV